jgi:hypothetical protein
MRREKKQSRGEIQQRARGRGRFSAAARPFFFFGRRIFSSFEDIFLLFLLRRKMGD